MSNPEFDIIIVGGGIAGLYKAYEILKNKPKTSILLLEGSNRLGGRIYTYHDKHYPSIEAGASRFHGNHRRLWKLLHELGLKENIVPIETTKTYIPKSGETHGKLKGRFETLVQDPSIYSSSPSWNMYIQQVIHHAKRESKKSLQNMTFLAYASKVLPPDQSQSILESFGYSLELTDMNAYDTIQLITNHMNEQFYVLKGGLEQIVTRMVEKLTTYSNFQYKLGEPVLQGYGEPNRRFPAIEIKTTKQTYYSHTCIFALPKEQIEKIPFKVFLGEQGSKDLFHSIKPIIKNIKNLPLCRIYTRFSRDPQTNEVWFQGMKKFTTNNRLRYVIPIDETRGIIMISYSDGKYANYWHNLRETPQELNAKLQQQVQQLFPDKKIPMPRTTKMFYWKHGVAYFQPGMNSSQDMKKIREPFPGIPVYICGENYSEKNAQWIEGALE